MGRGISPSLLLCFGGYKIKVLSLDQSTKKTGWALFEKDQFCGCGLIDFDRDTYSPEERFILMCKAVSDLIHRETPDFVVCEGLTYQRNAATLIELAQLQGTIIGTCLNAKRANGQIEFYIYPASSWRKALHFIQGKGVKRPELKRQAQDYALKTYGLDLDEDAADAVSIGSAFIISFMKEKTNGKRVVHDKAR